MLRFSANLSLLFTEVELIDRFQLAKQHGFNAVEIQFPYSLNPKTIGRILSEQQLELVLFNVNADDLLQGGEGLASVPEKQEQFQQAVSNAVTYARHLKPKAINVLPGRCFNKKLLPEYLDTFKKNLCFATDAFSPLGIKTVFEAINSHDMPDFIIDNSKKMLEVLMEINRPNVFMQYDIYHAVMMGENPADFIRQYAEKIGHIQFADCPGRGQPGTGQIDFRTLFSDIKKSAYSAWVGAEYKPVGTTLESLSWMLPIEL